MGGVVGAQSPQSGGQQSSPGTGKYGGIASQGGGSNPFQQYQGAGIQQASPGNSYYPQTQQQPSQAGAGKYGGMTGQQSVPQGVPPEVSQQYQQQQQQRPFQAQQPNYGALFGSLASMFGGQQNRAPFSNYHPVQSANNFQLRNTYQFDPATDPSRQYAARVKAEADQKEAEAAAAKVASDAAAQSQTQQTSYEMGSPGNARGGRINSPNKKIRAALLTAKGVQAKAVPSSHGMDTVHTVIDPATVDHPAADIPGVHLRAGRMGKAGGGALTAPGMPAPEEEDSITAYHGSPYSFEEFDPAYIGKGEGAQAFGHGLYFADNEGVAKNYRDALSGDLVTPEGEKTNWQGQGSKYFGRSALQQSMDKKLSGDEAIRDAIQDLHFNAGLMQRRDIKQRYYDAANSLGSMLGKQWKIDPGHMYEVRLKARPEHFLDWDKPLSEQHPHVIAALQMNRELPPNTGLNTDKTYSKTLGHFVASDTTGKDVVNGNPDAKNLSERLSAAGIRGIRYLDAGSRSQGDGTHNYVVFDPKHIEVARKYERGGEVEGEAEPQPQFSVSNPMPVFPKPQRMWDDQRPGGAYLSMPDKADVTGHRAAQAEIGVKPGGKPFFNASRDAVDATGSPGRGSATVKTNLFKKKAGWQWAQAPEGHEATDTIVSVDHRGKHHYALNVQFPKGVDLSRYEKAASEPRLRPTTKGNLEFGEQAGTILVRGKEHPVYHNVTVRSTGGRVGYAGGGGEDDPTVQKALGLTQGVQPTAPQMARRLNDQGLYSHAAEAAAALPQAKGSPQQMKATLKGVKQEELAGFDEAFDGRSSVTRDEMAQHFNDRMPQIETKILGGEGGKPTQYSQYTLPGGENYREMLLKTPENPSMRKFQSSHWKDDPNVLAHLRLSDRTGPSGEKVLHVEEIQSDWGQQGREEGFLNPDSYRKWKEARNKVDALENAHEELVNNVLSPQFQLKNPKPTRKEGESLTSYYENVDKFDDAEVNFITSHPEWIAIQDKITKAHDELVPLRKALLREGKTPTGPYVGNTQAWTDLALKAALKEAAHGNYDRVAWTQGHDQANRYGLIKNMHRLAYDPEDKNLSYYNNNDGWEDIAYNVEPEEVHKHIGQEAAKKLLAQPLNRGNGRQFLDVDMQSGGEGMKSYYDKIVPNRIMDVAKKAGAPVKVEPHKIDTAEGEKTLHSIRMTPELRAAIMRGLPVYKAGGRVGYNTGGGEDDPVVQKALGLTHGSMLPPTGSALNHGDTYVGQNAPTHSEAGSQAGELPFGRSLPRGEGIVPSQHQAPLEGLPTRIKIPLTGEVITAGPNHLVRSVAEQYMRDAGLPYNPPKKYAKVDLTRGKRISNEYEQMEDNANHPLVKAAYDAMVNETMAQYRAAKAAGLKLSFWNPEKEKNPYEASPRLVIKDVNENHHMYVFPTQFGFGSKEISPEDVKRNPLLAPTGEHWNGIPVTVNDVFRAVHDYFGHAKEGSGFRSDGEENAWRSHASMYSPLARLALTSETRGQNSWLNFGPHGENNRNASTEDTVFAPQKVGIMPAWTAHEGAEDFITHEDRKVMEKIHKQYGRSSGGRIGYGTGGGEDDPVVQKALGLTQQAQPNPVQMAQQVLPQAQPAPQANLMPKAVADQPVTQTTEDFNFNINRGKRKEVKAKLAPEDTQIINQIAQTHKLTPEEVEYSYRRIKNRFPTSEWAPFNIVGAEIDNEKKVVRDAEGYPELKVQEQAYNFHKPKGSEDQRMGATDWDPAHLNRVTKNIVKAVKEVANREDAGDKNASVIMKARNWYRAMRDRLRQEYGGFADTMADTLGATSAQTGVRQNWDNTIEALSEFSRGSYDRALGKLQDWVDNGGEMGSASVAAGKGYINGHLNDLKAALPAATEQAKSEGLTNEKQIQKRAKDIAFQKAQEGEFPLITKADGRTLFNANTPATMMAFLDKFRERKAGDSPKTPNFTGNLIGYSDKATIDLWAARFLRRMTGMKPVPTVSESGVSGSYLDAPLKTGIQTGGEFGFGQQAFQNAAKELRKDPRFAGLGDDDLQAIVWFLEKEHWTKNDWTNKTGEGGSFEQEANFAGVPDRAKLKELRQQSENDTTATDRRKISSFLSDKAPLEAAQKAYDENKWILEHGTSAKQRDAVMERMGITDKTQAVELAKSILGTAKAAGSTIQKYPAAEQKLGALEQKAQETRTSATQQLNDMQAVARRFVGGLSPDREENPATPEIFAEGQSAIGQAVNSTPGVIMSKATPSRGRYIDPTGNIYDEKAYDLEFVTRQNFDPANTWKSIVGEGQRRNQQAVFLSEVVSPGAVENANPGMEVYFTKKLDDKATESLTKVINELGIDAGFTFVTDFRAKDRLAGGAPHGQYVGLRLQYIPELGGSPGGSEKAKDDMMRAIDEITKFDGVSHAKYVEYDTQVAMEDEYERHLAGHVPKGRQAQWHRQRFGAGDENPTGSQGVSQGSPGAPPVYRRWGGQTNARHQTKQTSLDPGLSRALQLTSSTWRRG